MVQVRATFGAGNRIVAGCMVNEGMLRKGCFLVVKRGKKVGLELLVSAWFVDRPLLRAAHDQCMCSLKPLHA